MQNLQLDRFANSRLLLRDSKLARELATTALVPKNSRVWLHLDPKLGLIAKPLYRALKGTDVEPLIWTTDCKNAFEKKN